MITTASPRLPGERPARCARRSRRHARRARRRARRLARAGHRRAARLQAVAAARAAAVAGLARSHAAVGAVRAAGRAARGAARATRRDLQHGAAVHRPPRRLDRASAHRHPAGLRLPRRVVGEPARRTNRRSSRGSPPRRARRRRTRSAGHGGRRLLRIAGATPEHVVVIPNGVDEDDFAESAAEPARRDAAAAQPRRHALRRPRLRAVLAALRRLLADGRLAARRVELRIVGNDWLRGPRRARARAPQQDRLRRSPRGGRGDARADALLLLRRPGEPRAVGQAVRVPGERAADPLRRAADNLARSSCTSGTRALVRRRTTAPRSRRRSSSSSPAGARARSRCPEVRARARWSASRGGRWPGGSPRAGVPPARALRAGLAHGRQEMGAQRPARPPPAPRASAPRAASRPRSGVQRDRAVRQLAVRPQARAARRARSASSA